MSKDSFAKITVFAGALMLLLIPAWSIFAMPAMVEQSASNMETTVQMEGNARLLNPSTGELDDFSLSMSREITISTANEKTTVEERTVASDIHTGKLLDDAFQLDSAYVIDALDRTVAGRADGARWSFPMNLQKRDYLIIDSELTSEYQRGALDSDVVLAVYTNEEKRNGVKTYRFEQDSTIYCGSVDPSFGAPEDSTQQLVIKTTYWVEPRTGQMVDMARSSERYIFFPDLARYPHDLDISVPLVGQARVLDKDKLGSSDIYDHFNMTVKRNVKVEKDLDSVYIFSTSTELFNRDSGEKMPPQFQIPTARDGVDPVTGEIVTGYGDRPRYGFFNFPMGAEMKNYTLWSYETDSPVTAVFVNTSQIQGETVYVYRLIEENKSLGPMAMEGIEFLRSQSSEMEYYVEPRTGMVVDVRGWMEQEGTFSDLAMMPADLCISYEIEGWARMMDQEKMDPDNLYSDFFMSLSKEVEVVSQDKGLLVVRTKTTGERGDGDELPPEFLEEESFFTVNPRTAEYASGRDGRLTFPIGSWEDVYWIWSQEAGASLPARYSGDGDIMGIPVRIFKQEADMLYLYDRDIPLSDNTLSLYYSGVVEYYVEPKTGVVIDVKSTGSQTARFGKIAELPPQLDYQFWFEGVLDSPFTGRQNINLTKTLTGVNTEYRDGMKIRHIYDNNTMRNISTGNIITLGSVSDLCAVDASTALHVHSYGFEHREGGFYFPQYCQKTDYPVWNQEMGVVDTALYQKEVYYDGLKCYEYLVEYYKRDMGSGITFDNRIVYTVEPVSGMIVDTHLTSSQKYLGFVLTKLDIKYTDETIVNKTREAKTLKGLMEALDERDVVAAEFYYSFTPQQVVENVAFARGMLAQLPLSNTTITIAYMELEMDPAASTMALKQAVENATLLEKFSNKKVLVMSMEISFSEDTAYYMSDMAQGNVRLLLLSHWGVPALLVLGGGTLLIVAIFKNIRRADDE
ncbi:MAG TPA: DUF3068 domain-containing protein [Euryarchaeota archaeon]|nr:DUF3068 domain-containing protein [Euryarchaeota archaeon]